MFNHHMFGFSEQEHVMCSNPAQAVEIVKD